MSERVPYREVPESVVREAERELARLVCRRAARELGLGAVAIRWLAEAAGGAGLGRAAWSDDGPIAGCIRRDHPGTIWLVAGRPPAKVVETVAHECRHLWQVARRGDWRAWWDECDAPHRRAEQEADATEYAARLAKALGW